MENLLIWKLLIFMVWVNSIRMEVHPRKNVQPMRPQQIRYEIFMQNLSLSEFLDEFRVTKESESGNLI